MRVTQSMIFRQSLETMQDRQAAVIKAQDQIASGQRLTQAMDDPAAMSRAMRNDDSRLRLDRFADNIGLLESRLSFSEAQLDSVTDLMHRGRELLVQGANATQSSESLSALATELRALSEGMVDIANSRDGQGRYLFAGHDDSIKPFVAVVPGFTYQGAAAAREVPIDDDRTMADGLVGDDVFLNGPAGDLLSLFGDIADILEAPTPDATTAAARQADIETSFNRLDDGLGHILGIRAQLGADLQNLERTSDRLIATDIELAANSSELRDTDLAEAISNMSLEMTALEAARTTFVQVQGLSLFDFIR